MSDYSDSSSEASAELSSASTSASDMDVDIQQWVRDEHRKRCFDEHGKRIKLTKDIEIDLCHVRPAHKKEIKDTVKIINEEHFQESKERFGNVLKWIRKETEDHPRDANGSFVDKGALLKGLYQKGCEFAPGVVRMVFKKIEKQNKADAQKATANDAKPVVLSKPVAPSPKISVAATQQAPPKAETQRSRTEKSLESWVYDQYFEVGFRGSKKTFIGYKELTKKLVALKSTEQNDITTTIRLLRKPGHVFSFPDLEATGHKKPSKPRSAATQQAEVSMPLGVNPSDEESAYLDGQSEKEIDSSSSVYMGAAQVSDEGILLKSLERNPANTQSEIQKLSQSRKTSAKNAVSTIDKPAAPGVKSLSVKAPTIFDILSQSRETSVNGAKSTTITRPSPPAQAALARASGIFDNAPASAKTLLESSSSKNTPVAPSKPSDVKDVPSARLVPERESDTRAPVMPPIFTSVNPFDDLSQAKAASLEAAAHTIGTSSVSETTVNKPSAPSPFTFSLGSSQTQKPSGTGFNPGLVHRLDHASLDRLSGDSHLSSHKDEGAEFDIRNGALISESIIDGIDQSLLPQYGFVGTQAKRDASSSRSKLFLNTNIPFSAFICGVQGSGKSHTTSCLLENCLLRSPMLGHLQSPLSALVFSYGDFTSAGSFNISEAAFLSSPHRDFAPSPAISKITVLVAPSNYLKLKPLYERLPNVQVLQFKLRPQSLDIGTMLTLMAVDQSSSTTLYMAQVTKILRDMATLSKGGFDYKVFKKQLDQQTFSREQQNFLDQRLGLLESFMDLQGAYAEPQFKPGEITIMDMSCPFIDPNTACILFKIGMKKYLESKVRGKMIVLDEAHKYMIDVPGAKDLNEYLLTTIRQQRHFGARVIISTQEPTISTSLIALCNITVIHRFTSPEWFHALEKHICMSKDNAVRDELFQKILNLRTGEAFMFAPTAVLGRDEEQKLIKATTELLEVRVRKRITSDGGQSVYSVA